MAKKVTISVQKLRDTLRCFGYNEVAGNAAYWRGGPDFIELEAEVEEETTIKICTSRDLCRNSHDDVCCLNNPRCGFYKPAECKNCSNLVIVVVDKCGNCSVCGRKPPFLPTPKRIEPLEIKHHTTFSQTAADNMNATIEKVGELIEAVNRLNKV